MYLSILYSVFGSLMIKLCNFFEDTRFRNYPMDILGRICILKYFILAK